MNLMILKGYTITRSDDSATVAKRFAINADSVVLLMPVEGCEETETIVGLAGYSDEWYVVMESFDDMCKLVKGAVRRF